MVFVGWSSWSQWGYCSKTCKGGVQMRRRVCYGGTDDECQGESTHLRPCNTETPCESKFLKLTSADLYLFPAHVHKHIIEDEYF